MDAGSKRARLLFGPTSNQQVKAGITNISHNFFQLDASPLHPVPYLIIQLLAFKMTKKSLLRYIFRHGPTAKERNEIAALKDNPATREKTSTHNNEPQDCQPSAAAKETAEPAFDFDLRFDGRQASGLEGIAKEENNGDNDDASSSSTESVATIGFDASPLSTAELLAATLHEARDAVHAHLESLYTTLSLLDALEGFSATIPVLREETKEKMKTCEEQIVALHNVETMVEGLPSQPK
jgi:hypothetical protein